MFCKALAVHIDTMATIQMNVLWSGCRTSLARTFTETKHHSPLPDAARLVLGPRGAPMRKKLRHRYSVAVINSSEVYVG
jgi:hypothetical protein